MDILVCKLCGHLEFQRSEECPVCYSPKDLLVKNNNVFKRSSGQLKEIAEEHIPWVGIETKKLSDQEPPRTYVSIYIGKKFHLMEKDHFIQFIDCYLDDVHIDRMQLTPHVLPAFNIHPKNRGQSLRVVSKCNQHGYWQTEVPLA